MGDCVRIEIDMHCFLMGYGTVSTQIDDLTERSDALDRIHAERAHAEKVIVGRSKSSWNLMEQM